MKKFLSYVFISLLAAGMAGCSDDQIVDDNTAPKGGSARLTVTGTIVQDETTRVALADNETSITPSWEVNDEVFGFYGESNTLTYKVASVNAGVATFTLESGTEPGDETTVYMIYAPNKSASDLSTNQLSVDLSVQDGTLAGVKSHAIMCATATVADSKLNLSFENQVAIMGIRKFTGLKESTTYTSATFTSAGPQATVKVVDGELKLVTDDAYGTITATGSFQSDGTGCTTSSIYFAVPPTSAVDHMFCLNSASDDRVGSISSKAIDAGKFIYMTTKSMREYVDLGLPSHIFWATCNVGASTPEGFGTYYAWGEVTPHENGLYWWNSYTKLGDGSEGGVTKYTASDHLTRLLPEDDAATVNWGNSWRMPTKPEFDELVNPTYTTSTWTSQNGVNGMLFTSKINGKSIFLPAAGLADYTYTNRDPGACNYPTSDVKINDYGGCYDYKYNSNRQDSGYGRCAGRPVRAVLKPLSVLYQPVVTTGTTDGHAWVQLWEGGPKWAEFNVGSTLTDYANATGAGTSWGGADSPYSNSNCGGHYSFKGNQDRVAGANIVSDTAKDLWGSNWATPSKEDFDNMLSKCTMTYCDGTTVQYVPGCTLKGWKVSGGGNYEANTIFLPMAGISDQNAKATEAIGTRGCYWSSTSGGYGAYYLHLYGSSSTSVTSHNQPHGCSVRAICIGE